MPYESDMPGNPANANGEITTGIDETELQFLNDTSQAGTWTTRNLPSGGNVPASERPPVNTER